jgi:hypothetical protein
VHAMVLCFIFLFEEVEGYKVVVVVVVVVVV